jgi:Inner membrane component of T3SS, cytoplasmic domain
MFLDSLIATLRAPFDFIRTKIFGVKSIKAGAIGDVKRLKGVGAMYKDEVGNLAGQAKAAQGKAAGVAGKAPKKKMGLFSKKKKCAGCGQKLHASWDQCPYCGAAVNAPPPQAVQAAPVMAAPMPSPQGGGKMKTMAIDVGGGAVMVSGQAGSGWLVPLDGPQTGELFALTAGRCVVGTAPDCNVVVRDPSISGRHAEFSVAGRGYRVQDLGSTNGTYVNDKRVTQEDLIDGDTVRLGRTNFKFKSMS